MIKTNAKTVSETVSHTGRYNSMLETTIKENNIIESSCFRFRCDRLRESWDLSENLQLMFSEFK